jgi:hypothetical protein
LSPTGQQFASLTNEYDEPLMDFEVLWSGIAFARAELTRELDLTPEAISATDRVASLEPSLELERLGLISLADGRPTATSALAFALVAGTGVAKPDRTAVGDLAERFSVRYLEDLSGPASSVVRVSELSDRFGYDVLVLRPGGSPSAYECKGTTGSWPLHIFVSRHEIRTAAKLGAAYQLLVWGDIRLTEDFEIQYGRLTSSGYPIVLSDPQRIFQKCWDIPPACVTEGPVRAAFSVAAIDVELRSQ